MIFPIKMYDPTRDYNQYKIRYDGAIGKVLENGNFINGIEVKDLEYKLAKYINVNECICVGNGTDALQIALMALGIKSGDEVITVAHTWISTVEVISILGAIPVFVDISPKDFNIDTTKIEDNINKNTKAMIIVSLYGLVPDMDHINNIASKYNIPVIEDAAQSFGAKYKNRFSCSLTTIGCTSFFPSKPLGCYGDGGALFTNDTQLALKIRAIKNHGGLKRFCHEYIGINSRLDTIQAGIIDIKLNNFNDCILNRNNVANEYTNQLADLDNLTLPRLNEHGTHVWAQYSILAPTIAFRDIFVDKLNMYNIQVSVFYPIPIHFQPCFLYLGYKEGSLPITENIAERVFNLPCYGELSMQEQVYIIDRVKDIYKELF